MALHGWRTAQPRCAGASRPLVGGTSCAVRVHRLWTGTRTEHAHVAQTGPLSSRFRGGRGTSARRLRQRGRSGDLEGRAIARSRALWRPPEAGRDVWPSKAAWQTDHQVSIHIDGLGIVNAGFNGKRPAAILTCRRRQNRNPFTSAGRELGRARSLRGLSPCLPPLACPLAAPLCAQLPSRL